MSISTDFYKLFEINTEFPELHRWSNCRQGLRSYTHLLSCEYGIDSGLYIRALVTQLNRHLSYRHQADSWLLWRLWHWDGTRTRRYFVLSNCIVKIHTHAKQNERMLPIILSIIPTIVGAAMLVGLNGSDQKGALLFGEPLFRIELVD